MDRKRRGKGVIDWKPVVSWWKSTHANKLLEIEVFQDGSCFWYVTDARGVFLTGGNALTVNQAKRYVQEAVLNRGYPNGAKKRKSPTRTRKHGRGDSDPLDELS